MEQVAKTGSRCRRRPLAPALFILALGLFAVSLQAAVSLPSVFGNGMVLQREEPVPVYGWASAGEVITVSFASQTVSTTADGAGRWRVDLAAMPSSATGLTLTVVGSSTLTFTDVLVGEVWIAAGQSNMEYLLSSTDEYGLVEPEIKAGTLTGIRHFVQDRNSQFSPQEDCLNGRWIKTENANLNAVKAFCSVPFYFARKLSAEEGVPVGILQAAWSAARIEAFISYESSQNDADVKAMFDSVRSSPAENHRSCGIYNGMIHPLAPYGVRGALWLQGESNVSWSWAYRKQLVALIDDWRMLWEKDIFWFGICQIHNWNTSQDTVDQDDEKANMREVQAHVATAMPHTFLVNQMDAPDISDYDGTGGQPIHPNRKLPASERLAAAARHWVYQAGPQPLSPEYIGHRINGDKVIVYLDQVGGGLSIGSGLLDYTFVVAGSDRVWHPADSVTVAGDTLEVSASSVPAPVALRALWDVKWDRKVFTADGLPFGTFRTDGWAPRIGDWPNDQYILAVLGNVQLFHPLNNQVFPDGSMVVLAADASIDPVNAPNREMGHVEFYNGAERIGEASGHPAVFRWYNVPAGTYSITAKSRDTTGIEISSRTATITVSRTAVPQVPTYGLQVTNGVGGGQFAAGDLVRIKAAKPAIGKVFNGWTGDTAVLNHTGAEDAFLRMPSCEVHLTADYSDGDYLMYADFTGPNPGGQTPWMATHVMPEWVTYSGILLGDGAYPPGTGKETENALAVSFNGNSVRKSLADAIADNQYISMIFSPDPDQEISLQDAALLIEFVRRDSNNPQSISVFTNVGGFTAGSEIGTVTQTGYAVSRHTIPFPATGYDALAGPLEIRLLFHKNQWGDTNRSPIAISELSVGLAHPQDGFSIWQGGIAWDGRDNGEAGDPDEDGLVNLLEYALFRNPLEAQGSPWEQIGMQGFHLEITFARIADPDLLYTVEGASDLENWTRVWSSTGPANTAGPVTVADPSSCADGQRFLRLRITR